MRKVDVVKANLQTCIEVARKRMQVEEREERRNRWKEGMSEIRREELDAFFEDIDGSCGTTYSREEYLDELESAMQALNNIEPNEELLWVSEDKMGEIFENHHMEECFCNNAVIIAECNNYCDQQHMWLICLIKRN